MKITLLDSPQVIGLLALTDCKRELTSGPTTTALPAATTKIPKRPLGCLRREKC